LLLAVYSPDIHVGVAINIAYGDHGEGVIRDIRFTPWKSIVKGWALPFMLFAATGIFVFISPAGSSQLIECMSIFAVLCLILFLLLIKLLEIIYARAVFRLDGNNKFACRQHQKNNKNMHIYQ